MTTNLLSLMFPETLLAAVACVLFLLGASRNITVRRWVVPVLAVASLLVVVVYQATQLGQISAHDYTRADAYGTFRLYTFGAYVKLLAAAVGVLLLLLAWPGNRDGSGNPALNFGEESGEFFGLMLLSLTGIFLVAGANDVILLFLGLELASIPTYVMVSISRPLPVAQEAGVKYFFLGAMAAALMLFGFSYLYGVTGSINLQQITSVLHPQAAGTGALVTRTAETAAASASISPWALLAVLMVIGGLAFKIAAVPLHVYAGDVYQGAATPVTAFLSFVPKTSGMVALIKILAVAGGPFFSDVSGNAAHGWALPPQVFKLLWVLAVLTMTVGNVLGLLQQNIKRLLACSSIAHSGYMLTGLAALAGYYQDVSIRNNELPALQTQALQGVLFYLTAYGIMNAGAFGVLMLLPAREGRPGTSAETFDDIAGQGRKHVGLGLAMAVCCFSLIGIPLTVGFVGKLMLIRPALSGHNYWLVIFTVVNAAISAAYYLRIVGAMFLRPPEEAAEAGVAAEGAADAPHGFTAPITAAIVLSVAGTLLFGSILPATDWLATGASAATRLDNGTSNTTRTVVSK